MTYFTDLSTYEYLDNSSDRRCLNIGWLSGEFKYPTGKIEGDVLEKIKSLFESLENLTRGVHYCEFCEPPIFSPRGENFVSTLIKDAPNGNGEIWVDADGGVKFIAPALLVHYIEAHNYLPPKEFLTAVQSTK